MPPAHDLHLIGEAGPEGNERHEIAPLRDDPSAVPELIGEDVAVEAAAAPLVVAGLRCQLPLYPWRQVRKSVDLAVWVRKRHADLLAPVLEDVDVLHVIAAAQLPIAVSPDLDQVADLRLG